MLPMLFGVRLPWKKKLRDCSALSVWKPKAEPCNVLPPDLVITVRAAPPVIPCSASNASVLMLTVSMDSAGGTYMMCEVMMFILLIEPSRWSLLALRFVPLILAHSSRCGELLTVYYN